MPRYVLLLLLSGCASLLAISQPGTVAGTVINAGNRQPVPLASVYFSNTSIGMVTAADGGFVFSGLPPGQFDLVVSFVGYQTFITTVNTANAIAPLTIVLQPRPAELQAVTIEPYQKQGWDRWGTFFLEQFIGLTAESGRCRILNAKALEFRHYKKSNRLVAIAHAPLRIENKALGYSIEYTLEHFEYQFKTGILFYQGYPLFKMMKGNQAAQKRWQESRQHVYLGSVMHFMRTLYRNRLAEEGFEIRQISPMANLAKQRARDSLLKQMQGAGQNAGKPTVIRLGAAARPALTTADNNAADAADIYRNAMAQPDTLDVLHGSPLPADSVAFGLDSTTAGFAFTYKLEITYIRAPETKDYTQYKKQGSQQPVQQSQLRMLGPAPVMVFANGGYYDNKALLMLGYWAFKEKMATMLPLDYKPLP